MNFEKIFRYSSFKRFRTEKAELKRIKFLNSLAFQRGNSFKERGSHFISEGGIQSEEQTTIQQGLKCEKLCFCILYKYQSPHGDRPTPEQWQLRESRAVHKMCQAWAC